MNRTIISNTCISCAKTLFELILAAVLVGALIVGVIWGLPLIAVPIWKNLISPLWREYCAFALSSPPWTALIRWVIPATVAVWAACVTHKLSAENVKKASRVFGVIALTFGTLALLVLAPMLEKVQAVRLGLLAPVCFVAFVFTAMGLLITSAGITTDWE